MMSVVMDALDPSKAVMTIHRVNQGPTYTNLCGQANLQMPISLSCSDRASDIWIPWVQYRTGPYPNHVKRVLMAIIFSSKVHSLSSALITLTAPSAATTSSALQKSAIYDRLKRVTKCVARTRYCVM